MKKIFLMTISLGLLAGLAAADDCCTKKGDAKACGMKMTAEQEFMAEAAKMMAKAEKLEAKKDECCTSTEAKVVVKEEKGCCNAPGEPAKFKVYVAGVGYKFFGCPDSAAQGRKMLAAKHTKVGEVQKVTGKVMIH